MKNRIRCFLLGVVVFLFAGCAKSQEAKLVDSFMEEHMDANDFALQTDDTQAKEENEQSDGQYYVYVCGAVKYPGVYALDKGSRVNDALVLAGGFLEDANQEYYNLAEPIMDGQKIYIPTYDEVLAQEEQERESAKININTASKEVLMTLPGIGSSKADSIILFREEQGRFETIEDIMQIPGIKESVFSKIKELITVG